MIEDFDPLIEDFDDFDLASAQTKSTIDRPRTWLVRRDAHFTASYSMGAMMLGAGICVEGGVPVT